MEPAAILASPVGLCGLAQVQGLRAAARRMGIETVRQLLFHLPRRYDDLRDLKTLAEIWSQDDGTVASANVRVTFIGLQKTWRRNVQVVTAHLTDGTDSAEATWFGRRYIERRLHEGDEILLSGKIRHRGHRLVFEGPDFQPVNAANLLHVGRIVPVYRLTKGVTSARLRGAMRAALDAAGLHYEEYLPAAIRAEHALPAIGAALDAAHFPADFEARDAALRRLAFDELLALQLGMVGRRRARGRARTRALDVPAAVDATVRRAITASLGRKLGREVDLTPDQVTTISQVREDLARPVPMLRLVQGDVGSGKTAVAAWALAAAAIAGRQGALLAPTDLLARQHAVTVAALLEDLGVECRVELLTGSMSAPRRREVAALAESGQANIIVGTHALLQESLRFADLALAVVDEQHRFGVEQRGALEAKAPEGTPPHVLLMTATPIPRTLGQVIYADLDVSVLRTPPAGRIAIRTGIRRPDDLERTWQRVREEAAAGRRTFVVVPRIGPAVSPAEEEAAGYAGDADLPDEELQEQWAAAAEAEFARLTDLLAPLRVGLVHGRLHARDRDATMARFRDGDLDVLVGTTVVEVGVDVPQATLMIIEGAERFGLAQLHQLRGRVGRGTDASFCVLVSEAAEGTTEHERLKAVATIADGFELAERDFELRREGDVLGLAQSGLPRLRVATLANPDHRVLAQAARSHAEELLDAEGTLLPVHLALGAELAHGWLQGIHAGDPADTAPAA